MLDWWSYSAEDFVPYSAKSYWRLIDLYNSAVWPMQVFALAVGIICLWHVFRPHGSMILAFLVVLAITWVWVGWRFLLGPYASINWAAPYMAALFFLQAGILAMVPAITADTALAPISGQRKTGALILGYAVLLHPLLPFISGRPLATSEVFAIAPDPTALGTIGFALAVFRMRAAFPICLLPTIWCGLRAVTHSVLAQTEAYVLIGILGSMLVGLAAARMLNGQEL